MRRVSRFVTIRERDSGGLCLSFLHHMLKDPGLVGSGKVGQVHSRTGSGYPITCRVAWPQTFLKAAMFAE